MTSTFLLIAAWLIFLLVLLTPVAISFFVNFSHFPQHIHSLLLEYKNLYESFLSWTPILFLLIQFSNLQSIIIFPYSIHLADPDKIFYLFSNKIRVRDQHLSLRPSLLHTRKSTLNWSYHNSKSLSFLPVHIVSMVHL